MSYSPPARPITAAGIEKAADRVSSTLRRTPLIENDDLNAIAGGRILIKAEVLQHYGSFKIRGAYNRLSQLSETEKKAGVVAWSSGNHAQGVAYAAKLLGLKSTIVMPEDAPRIKIDNVRRLGSEIVLFDRYTEDREEIALGLAEQFGYAVTPSYDHPDVIEGQGTLGLEIYQDAAQLGVQLDGLITPCGGGGLAAGCSVILADKAPECEMMIAEPENFDETWVSIKAGKRLPIVDPAQRTICDAIATPSTGQLTFPILQKYVRQGFSLSETDVQRAMAFAFEKLKLVVEPGGSVALAAILSGKIKAAKENVAIVLSGGNVDKEVFSAALQKAGV